MDDRGEIRVLPRMKCKVQLQNIGIIVVMVFFFVVFYACPRKNPMLLVYTQAFVITKLNEPHDIFSLHYKRRR